MDTDSFFAARQLMSEDYLKETPVVGSFGSTVDLSPKAYDWLRSAKYGDAKLMLSLSQDVLLFERPASKPELSIVSK